MVLGRPVQATGRDHCLCHRFMLCCRMCILCLCGCLASLHLFTESIKNPRASIPNQDSGIGADAHGSNGGGNGTVSVDALGAAAACGFVWEEREDGARMPPARVRVLRLEGPCLRACVFKVPRCLFTPFGWPFFAWQWAPDCESMRVCVPEFYLIPSLCFARALKMSFSPSAGSGQLAHACTVCPSSCTAWTQYVPS